MSTEPPHFHTWAANGVSTCYDSSHSEARHERPCLGLSWSRNGFLAPCLEPCANAEQCPPALTTACVVCCAHPPPFTSGSARHGSWMVVTGGSPVNCRASRTKAVASVPGTAVFFLQAICGLVWSILPGGVALAWLPSCVGFCGPLFFF